MTVWGDVKALYGEGGLEVVTAVDNLYFRTVIQPDADSMTWLPDFRKLDDPSQLDALWEQHQKAILNRLAWLNRLTWLIQKGGYMLLPLPFLFSVLFGMGQETVSRWIAYSVGLVFSTILYFLRRQLTALVAKIGGRFLQGRLQKFSQDFLKGKFTPPHYGMET